MSLWPRVVLLDRLQLDHYPYLHSTRAELLRRTDCTDEARAAYERALALIHTDHERLFVERKLTEQRTCPELP